MSAELAVNFLHKWKFALAVGLPCFAVGLGVSYYYNSKMSSKTDLFEKSGQATANKSLIENDNVTAAAEKPQETGEVTGNPVKNRTKSRNKAEEYKRKGNIEYDQENYQKAIEFFSSAIEICPEFDVELMSILYQNRAIANSKLENYDDCIFDCNKSLEFTPLFTKALSRRGKSFYQIGNIKNALEDMTSVIMLNLRDVSETDIKFTNDLLKISGQKSLEEFKKHRSFNLPSSKSIYKYMTSFCDDPFNDEFSQSLINSDVNSGLEFALKCVKNKNYKGIEEACREELNKTNNSLIRRTLSLNLLGTISILCSNYEAGVKHLNTIIETPEAPKKLVVNSLIKRALVYYEEEKVEECFKDFKLAETINPNSSDVFYHRARIYLLEENSRKAIAGFKRATELSPTFVLSDIQYCYAQYYHAKLTSNKSGMKRFTKKLKELLVKYPNNEEGYTLYAQTLSDKGDYKEVDSILKKASELNPNNATFHVYGAINELSRINSTNLTNPLNVAFYHLESALKIDPKNSHAYEIMGKVLIKAGNLKEGIEYLEKSMPLTISERELSKVILTRDAIQAELTVVERFGLVPAMHTSI